MAIKGVLIITHDMQYKMDPYRVEWFCLLRLLKQCGLKVYVIAPYSLTQFDMGKWEKFTEHIKREADDFYLFPKKSSILRFINPFLPYVANKNKPYSSERRALLEFIRKINIEFNIIIQDHIYSFEITRYVIKENPRVLKILRTVNIETDFFFYHSKKYSLFDYKKYIGFFDGVRMKFYEPMVIEKMDMVLFLSVAEMKKMGARIKNIPFYFFPYIYSINSDLLNLSVEEEKTYKQLINQFGDRKIILFINNFSDGYNLKETIWFIEKIFPVIRKEEPRATFLCCGFQAEEYLKSKPESGIFVYSDVSSVKPFIKLADTILILTKNRIGIKSKFIEALYFKKKVISTTSGVYGSGLEEVAFHSENEHELCDLIVSSLRGDLDFSKLFEEFERLYII